MFSLSSTALPGSVPGWGTESSKLHGLAKRNLKIELPYDLVIPRHISRENYDSKRYMQDFPGGPGGKYLPASGVQPLAQEDSTGIDQLSPCTTVTEAHSL